MFVYLPSINYFSVTTIYSLANKIRMNPTQQIIFVKMDVTTSGAASSLVSLVGVVKLTRMKQDISCSHQVFDLTTFGFQALSLNQ